MRRQIRRPCTVDVTPCEESDIVNVQPKESTNGDLNGTAAEEEYRRRLEAEPGVRISGGESPPSSPGSGDFWSSDDGFYVYNRGNWESASHVREISFRPEQEPSPSSRRTRR